MSDERFTGEERTETGLLLTVIISFFFHSIFFAILAFPDLGHAARFDKLMTGNSRDLEGGRDVIVNINHDGKKVNTSDTLLSDKDSSAKGFITKDKGNRFLNNSQKFELLKGSAARKGSSGRDVSGGQKHTQKAARERVSGDESELAVVIEKAVREASSGEQGMGGASVSEKVLIPDKNDVTLKNALFYTNDSRFSFNTSKFKDFKYFMQMKDKIASNWNPPLFANSVIYGYDPFTGANAPGRTRIMAIPSQLVKIVFVMDRKGEVLEVNILDSMGNRPLDRSCVDAIKASKNFGKVPDDITGERVAIPFIFGYYVE
jgi:TonB family protein